MFELLGERVFSSFVAEALPMVECPSPEPSDLEFQPTVSCLDHLSTQIYQFHRRHEQSMTSLSEKLHLRDLLYYAIAPHFIGCGLYIVGSTLNGFGANSSDMDLCLMITPRDVSCFLLSLSCFFSWIKE